MKTLDYSLYGTMPALWKGFKVVLWVMASGAIAAAVAYLANYHLDAANIYQVALLALVNGVLATIGKWLKSVEPTEPVTTEV